MAKEITVVLSFIAVTFVWINFIYWLRIFGNITFYFTLIVQTLVDMQEFFLIFMLIIFACGNATFILNANRIPGDEGDSLYAESFTEGLGFLDAILN